MARGHAGPERTDDWVTVGFTALPPGWVHECMDEDARKYETPCPGVLLQELRGQRSGFARYPADSPYKTRIVFARHDEVDNTLVPADGVLHTWAPNDPRR